MAFSLTPERERRLEAILRRYPNKRAAMLPALWLCQEQNGWISPEVVQYVARRLEVSTAAVQGVLSFYTLLFDRPVAPYKIWVCRTLSCELRGAKTIQEHLERRLGCKPGQTSRCGRFTLLKAECLAACGQAPMVQINDRYYENLTIERLDRILDELEAKLPPGGTLPPKPVAGTAPDYGAATASDAAAPEAEP